MLRKTEFVLGKGKSAWQLMQPRSGGALMRVPGIVTEVIAELTTTYTMIVPPFRLASRTRTRRSCDSAKERRSLAAAQPAGIFGQTNPQQGLGAAR
jgi:hypothetical protein